jgi:2'-5' RNA ligase
MTTVRAFIAIDMPKSVVELIRCKQDALRKEGLRLRWVSPENVHLTIRFLGDIAVDDIDGIRQAVETAAAESAPPTVFAKGVGAFPKGGQPRVVWIGLGGELDALAEIYRRLNDCLAEKGIPPEKRPFKGHLTIGRIKGRMTAVNLHRYLEILGDVQGDSFKASRLCLYKSDPTPGGAVYTALARVEIEHQD